MPVKLFAGSLFASDKNYRYVSVIDTALAADDNRVTLYKTRLHTPAPYFKSEKFTVTGFLGRHFLIADNILCGCARKPCLNLAENRNTHRHILLTRKRRDTHAKKLSYCEQYVVGRLVCAALPHSNGRLTHTEPFPHFLLRYATLRAQTLYFARNHIITLQSVCYIVYHS